MMIVSNDLLSIIIINYNARDLTAQSVQSIFDGNPRVIFEIIIIENGEEPSQCYYDDRKQVRICRGIQNRGFGHACNIGAQNAKGELLLFLNNDTVVHNGTLDACAAYMKKNTKTGALSAKILLKDGTLDHGCKRGFPTPFASLCYYMGLDKLFPRSKMVGAYRQTFVGDDEVYPVEVVSGAFMMVPKVIFDAIQGFDETFFMYGEDIDLCYRIHEAGYQVIYYGKAAITHLKGQSGLNKRSREIIYHFYNSMKLFYRKHYEKKYNLLVKAMVYALIGLKYRTALKRSK